MTSCIAVGLTPTYELASHAGAQLQRVRCPEDVEDGSSRRSHVHFRIEEATTAMLEGHVHASLKAGHGLPGDEEQLEAWTKRLDEDRSGPFGEKIRED